MLVSLMNFLLTTIVSGSVFSRLVTIKDNPGLQAGQTGAGILAGTQGVSCYLNCLDWLWGTPDLIRWVLGVKQPGCDVDPTHFYPVPRLRMCGAIPLSPICLCHMDRGSFTVTYFKITVWYAVVLISQTGTRLHDMPFQKTLILLYVINFKCGSLCQQIFTECRVIHMVNLIQLIFSICLYFYKCPCETAVFTGLSCVHICIWQCWLFP